MRAQSVFPVTRRVSAQQTAGCNGYNAASVMGAGASFDVGAELTLPPDGSDLMTAEAAKGEVTRLRTLLQAYVEQKDGWPLDASDIVNGDDEHDYEVCLREVCNIRAAIRLQSSESERGARGASRNRDAHRMALMREEQEAARAEAEAAAAADDGEGGGEEVSHK